MRPKMHVARKLLSWFLICCHNVCYAKS